MIEQSLLNKNKLQLDRMGNINKKADFTVYQIMYGIKIPMFSNDSISLCEKYILQYQKSNNEHSFIIK